MAILANLVDNFMPETLMNAIIELEAAYEMYKNDPEFIKELEDLHVSYTGRRPYYILQNK